MTGPLVSVNVLTYNHAPYIDRALEGILSQETPFPVEIVIGEDHSTDGTRDKVFRWQQQRPDVIRVITSDANVGMKANYVRTLMASRGKYIAFCEGDDFWHSRTKLARQAGFLESNPDYGYTFSDYNVLHVDENRLIESFLRHTGHVIPEHRGIADIVRGDHGVLTCTAMMRSELCRRIVESDPYLHQDPRFLMGDTQLWAEASAVSKSRYMPESTATHVITTESATRSPDVRKRLRFSISNLQMLLYLCDKYSLDDELKSRLQEAMRRSQIKYAYHTHDAALAEAVLKSQGRRSLKDVLLATGARNRWFYHASRALVRLTNVFRKDNAYWR